MKNLKDIISEKLTINSKTKLGKHTSLSEKILYTWGFTDFESYENEKQIIDDWLKENNITEVYFACDKETLEECDFIDDKEYDTDYELNEYCQEYLSKADKLYTYKSNGEKYDIFGSEEMICICSYYGTLFCLDKKIVKNK